MNKNIIAYNLVVNSKEEYYRKHIELLTVFLPVTLTKKELSVLVSFMSLEDDEIDGYRFSRIARKKVREKLNISTNSLSAYIYSLRAKKYIVKKKNTLSVNKLIIPNTDRLQKYNFQILRK